MPPSHYAITMCNNLKFICHHLHPNTSLHLLLFYPILSSIAQLYIQSFMFQIIFLNFLFQFFLFIYIHICVFFILILFFCLCVVVVSVNWKLMTQNKFLVCASIINAISDSDSSLTGNTKFSHSLIFTPFVLFIYHLSINVL